DALAEDSSDDAVGRPLHQLPGEAAADAVAHVKEFADAEVIHQPKLVVGERIPRVIDRHWAGRFTAIGVALVHCDAAEIVLERLHRVEDRARPIADPRIQSAAGGNQKREAGARLLIADADIAFLIEWHGNSSSAECGVPRSIVAHRAVPRRTGGTAEGCSMWQFSPILAGAQPSCVRPRANSMQGLKARLKTPSMNLLMAGMVPARR